MRTRLYPILRNLLPVIIFLLAGSCANETEILVPTTNDENGDKPVVIRATIAGSLPSTRSEDTDNEYIPEEPESIKNRTLLFTYPSVADGGAMKSVPCTFNEEGIAYIQIEEEGNTRTLLWKDIYTVHDTNTIYLDNLVNYPVQTPNPDSEDILEQFDNFTKMRFGPPEEGFNLKDMTIEGIEDRYGGRYKWMIAKEEETDPDKIWKKEEVDIIWGKYPSTKTTHLRDQVGQPLHFELEHKMSAILFRFYSKDPKISEALKESEVTVYWDNVRVWIEDSQIESDSHFRPFIRYNGELLNYGQKKNLQKGVILAKKERLTPSTQNNDPDHPVYYETPVWIYPMCQELLTSRPQLTIEIDGTKYSGALPPKMRYWEIDSKGEWHLSTPVNLAFKSGYRHTFNVELVNKLDKQEILFHEVTVSPFIWYFNEKVTAAESGIYNWSDLKWAAKTYNESSSENNHKLWRYGKYIDGKWEFQLWRNIKIPEDEESQIFKDSNFQINRGSSNYEITQNGAKIDDKDLVKTSSTNNS